MSLDIEGGEFQVLKTIPWDEVNIEVMSIESHFLGVRTEGSLEDVIKFLSDKGYKHIPNAHKAENFFEFEETGLLPIQNDLFVKNNIAVQAGLWSSYGKWYKRRQCNSFSMATRH